MKRNIIKVGVLLGFLCGVSEQAVFCEQKNNLNEMTTAGVQVVPVFEEFIYSIVTQFALETESALLQKDLSITELAIFHSFIVWLITKNFSGTGAFGVQIQKKRLYISRGMLKTFLSSFAILIGDRFVNDSKNRLIYSLTGPLAGMVVRIVFELLPRDYCFSFDS